VVRRNAAALAAALALTPLDAVCGSGRDEGSRSQRPPTQAASPPAAEAEPKAPARTTDEHAGASHGKSQSGQAADASEESGSLKGSGSRRSYDPRLPDAPGNDKPPPPGSPAERFEQACEKDPHVCE